MHHEATGMPSFSPNSLGSRGLSVMLLWFAFASIGLFVMMVRLKIEQPGYDFRYFWLAGRVWLEGASPYGTVFNDIGAELIHSGHVPKLWPYPPNLFVPTAAIGIFDFETAWVVWSTLRTLALVAASAVLAFGLPERFLPGLNASRLRLSRLGFFALHLGIVAGTEAGTLSTIGGQFIDFIYLALCLALVGIARGRLSLAVAAALSVTFMKPQIGGILAVGLLISGRQGARLVAIAAFISILMLLPALVIRPQAIFDWMHVLGRYDTANSANWPISMTGVRNLVWVFGGLEISNLAASLMAVALAACVAVYMRRADRRSGADEASRLTGVVVAMTLVALACSPLHLYDFLFFGVAFLAFAGATGPRLVAAILCTLVILRPTALYMLCYGRTTSAIFLGSNFATVAAAVMLLDYLTRQNRGCRRRLPRTTTRVP